MAHQTTERYAVGSVLVELRFLSDVSVVPARIILTCRAAVVILSNEGHSTHAPLSAVAECNLRLDET